MRERSAIDLTAPSEMIAQVHRSAATRRAISELVQQIVRECAIDGDGADVFERVYLAGLWHGAETMRLNTQCLAKIGGNDAA